MLVSGSTPAGQGKLPLERPVDLVIFDCDGVLIDSEVISIRSIIAVLSACGYQIAEEDALQTFVGHSHVANRKKIEADWGNPLPSSFEEDAHRRTLDAMATSLLPIPGIADVLESLALPRCVASGSSLDWITLGLQKTGLFDHLTPHLFSASMVERGKPAPDVFLHAVRQMGSVPAKALVIEDSLPGVQAGVAAGMTVIGFAGGSHIIDKPAHGERLKSVGAHLVIDDMAELSDLIERTPRG